jgi:Tfp pilus assembly protein PilF
MPRARELTTRALQIDPDLPEAHAMLGVVKGQYDYDWAESERCFRRAVAREPLSPHLRQWYGTFFLLSVGRVNEALVQLDRVIEEDPLCQMWRMMRSNLFAGMGRLDDAIDEARKAVELDSAFWVGWLDLGVLLAIRRHHDEAMRCAERAMARCALVAIQSWVDGRHAGQQRTGRGKARPSCHLARRLIWRTARASPSTRWHGETTKRQPTGW